MIKLRGYIPTTALLVTLAFGSTVANAGIIVGDRAGKTSTQNTCSEPTTSEVLFGALGEIATFVSTGILVGDRGGIIVGDRSGIIVGDRACGIIVGDRNGIIVGD